jgi:hypothetical protein
MRIVLTTPRLNIRQFIEGSEQGEVEYALARPEWQARVAATATSADLGSPR